MTTRISLRHLRAFIALAETGSFTTASSHLFISQSSLTTIIKQFESAIGVKLFDRTTRRVILTREGASFKSKAAKIIRDFDGAISELQDYAQGNVGQIYVAASPSFIHHFMTGVMSDYRKSHPEITISLRDADAGRAEELLLAGEVDFAIASKLKNSDELTYTPLLADRFGTVCTPNFHLASSDSPIHWSELTPEGLVAFTADTSVGNFLRERMGDIPLLKGRFDEVSSTTALYATLNGKSCYSILPVLAATLPDFNGLHYRPLESPALYRQIYLITRHLGTLTPPSQQFLDAVLSSIQKGLPAGVVKADELSAAEA